MKKILITLYLFFLTTAPLPAIKLPIFTICSFFIIGYFLVNLLTNRKIIVDKYVLLLFLCLIVVVSISIVLAPEYVPLPGTISFYIKILFLSLWGISTFDLICRLEASQLYVIYYKSVFVMSFIGIILYILNYFGINTSTGVYTQFYIPRLQAFSQEPQGFAGFALLSYGIWHYYGDIIYSNFLRYFSIVVISIAILLTFSPVPIIVMSLYIIYKISKNGFIATLAMVATMVVVIMLNLDFFPYYYDIKFGSNILEASGTTRLHFWRVAWREYLEHPFSGVGPEGYGYYYDQFKLGLRDSEVFPQPPQNIVLGILANFGTIGGLYFIIFFIFPLIYLWLSRKTLDIETKTSIIIFILILILNMQIWAFTSQTLWFFLLLLYSRLHFMRHNPEKLQTSCQSGATTDSRTSNLVVYGTITN